MSDTSSRGRHVIALVDVSSMYVSCERVFQPKLQDRPVVVRFVTLDAERALQLATRH